MFICDHHPQGPTLLLALVTVCVGCGESSRPAGDPVATEWAVGLAADLPAEYREVAEQLQAADPLVRAHAVRQLGAHGPDGSPRAALLRGALRDPNWEVRADAAGALGGIGDREAIEPLIERLERDEVWSVRARAATALGALGDRRATLPLRGALGDMASFVRRAAAVALGEIADPAAVEALTMAAEADSDATVRAAANRALEKCTACATSGALIAYIGPGAGIALVGSFLAVFLAVLSAIGIILTWPIRRIWRAFRGRRALERAHVRRVVVLGLDGLDPDLTEQFLDAGLLPNMARLRDEGSYRRLGTSWPPLSPVAWSSFSTGTNPGRHNIFDFISRNPKTYGPVISSVRMRAPRRTLRLGRYVFPLSRPEMTSQRRSKPFWAVLGEAGIPSAVLRVPITFPPDRFAGLQLSAMCVPDLLGTQGTFTLYSERSVSRGADTAGAGDEVGGRQIAVERHGRRVTTYLEGPPNAFRADGGDLRLPITVEANGNGKALLKLDRQRVPLALGQFTPWVRVVFPMAPGIKLRGICQFYLKQLSPTFEMYCTPLQIDPDKPAMPIAHPTVYSTYLARRQGPFATLGLAEDTWSLSERLMTEDAFLDQAYAIHRERETMFFDALDRVRRGMVVCVFDGPDRIQHMFWRFLDPDHPALRGGTNSHPQTIRDMYIRMDQLVGQTAAKIDGDTALLVMSDHGFKPFRRGVDLNAWLREQGYLKLNQGATASDHSYLADVDWQATKAYAVGLAGLYINQSGREGQGTVPPGEEKRELVAEIVDRLNRLRDPETDQMAIAEAIPREEAYSGPYVDAAPDIVVGYNVGYRVAWGSAVGKTGTKVFSDNTKAWSGDHCIHPQRVPGVLLSNRKLTEVDPNIIDIGPTTLELLGVKKPAYMEGTSLVRSVELKAGFGTAQE